MGCAWGEVKWNSGAKMSGKQALINLSQVTWSNSLHISLFRGSHMTLGLGIHEMCGLHPRNMKVSNTASLAIL